MFCIFARFSLPVVLIDILTSTNYNYIRVKVFCIFSLRDFLFQLFLLTYSPLPITIILGCFVSLLCGIFSSSCPYWYTHLYQLLAGRPTSYVYRASPEPISGRADFQTISLVKLLEIKWNDEMMMTLKVIVTSVLKTDVTKKLIMRWFLLSELQIRGVTFIYRCFDSQAWLMEGWVYLRNKSLLF